jgi:xanthine dehydrogenase accessory factor
MNIGSVQQNWAQAALSGLDKGYVCLVSVAEAKGSVPREAGATMLVYNCHIDGSIGGGELEFQAIKSARKDRPEKAFVREVRSYPLGPALGQCCGGHVKLMFEWYGPGSQPVLAQLAAQDQGYSLHPTNTQDSPTIAIEPSDKMLNLPLTAQQQHVFLYGAGHVGRAVVEIARHLPCQIYWVDTDDDRYPEDIAEEVTKLPARQPETIAQHAPGDAIHLIMTYSHQVDFEIVSAVLSCGNFARCGLIGSKTKAARFGKRLRDAGLSSDLIERLTCPIGLPEITGKKPVQVAISVTAQLSNWLEA